MDEPRAFGFKYEVYILQFKLNFPAEYVLYRLVIGSCDEIWWIIFYVAMILVEEPNKEFYI